MDDKIKDYLKLGVFLLLNVAIFCLIYWMESNMSRLYRPSVFTLFSRNFLLLVIPSILAFKLVSYYSIVRYSIISLAVLNVAFFIIFGNITNPLTLGFLGLLLCWHVALYFVSVRKERKQILKEEQSPE